MRQMFWAYLIYSWIIVKCYQCRKIFLLSGTKHVLSPWGRPRASQTSIPPDTSRTEMPISCSSLSQAAETPNSAAIATGGCSPTNYCRLVFWLFYWAVCAVLSQVSVFACAWIHTYSNWLLLQFHYWNCEKSRAAWAGFIKHGAAFTTDGSLKLSCHALTSSSPTSTTWQNDALESREPATIWDFFPRTRTLCFYAV